MCVHAWWVHDGCVVQDGDRMGAWWVCMMGVRAWCATVHAGVQPCVLEFLLSQAVQDACGVCARDVPRHRMLDDVRQGGGAGGA